MNKAHSIKKPNLHKRKVWLCWKEWQWVDLNTAAQYFTFRARFKSIASPDDGLGTSWIRRRVLCWNTTLSSCSPNSAQTVFDTEETGTHWAQILIESSVCSGKKCPAQVLCSQTVTDRGKAWQREGGKQREGRGGKKKKSWGISESLSLSPSQETQCSCLPLLSCTNGCLQINTHTLTVSVW